MMKPILVMTLCALLLAACAPAAMTPTPAPAVAMPPTIALNTPQVKEVEMVTQTPVPPTTTPYLLSESGSPTVDPNRPTVTHTPAALFQTLADLGIPATTYEDRVSGLAFEYPSSWMISPMNENDMASAVIYSVTLRSGDVVRGPKQQEGIPPGMAAIDVAVIKNGPKTYEQAVDARRASATTTESGQPVRIVVDEEWILRDGLRAHHFVYNLGKDATTGADQMSEELVTMINSREILVSGMGDLSLFSAVASSLRELK